MFLAVAGAVAPRSSAQEILYIELFKGERFDGATPTANPFVFRAHAESSTSSFVTVGPTVKTPAGATQTLPDIDGQNFVFESQAATLDALSANFASGNYTVAFTGQFSGAHSVPITLAAGTIPPAPALAYLSAAQSIDASQDFTLTWAPFAGATATDAVELEIFDDTGSSVFNSSSDFQRLSGTNTSITLSSFTLNDGQTYKLALRFFKITASNRTTVPFSDAGYFSEATFTIKTAGAVSGPDTTPPTLSSVSPPDGYVSTITNFLNFALVFQFSESMSNVHSIEWSSNIDPAKVTYQWMPDGGTPNAVLVCSNSGGWPASAKITWKLNPTTTPPLFQDVVGNPLAINTYSGSFTTGPSDHPTSCAGGDILTNAGFALIKTGFYRQDNSGATYRDPNLPATIDYFVKFPPTANGLPPGPSMSLVNPDAHVLANIGYLNNQRASQLTAPTLGALDARFPAGNYVFEMLDATGVPTNSATLAVSEGIYPAIPHIQNLPATDAALAADFTLRWDAFTGATADSLVVVEVQDDSGAMIFRAPDACAGRTLDVSATSVVIPQGTFRPGTNYHVSVSFINFSDKGKLFATIDNPGVAALRRTTIASARAETEVTATPPPRVNELTSATPVADHMDLTFAAQPGANYALEGATALIDPTFWHPIVTNVATGPSITFSTDDLTDFESRYVRVRRVETKLPLTATNGIATLDLERQITSTPDDTGAEILLISAKDDVFDIAADPASFENAEDISVTAVTSIANLPFNSLIAAFEIAPAKADVGLALTVNAHFKTALPANAVPFGYNEITGEFFLLPWQQSGGTNIFRLPHLGIYGFADASSAQVASLAAKSLTDSTDQLIQSLALIQYPAAAAKKNSASVVGASTAAAPPIIDYDGIYNTQIVPELQAVQTPTSGLSKALIDYYNWWDNVAANGFLDNYQTEIESANRLAIGAIKAWLNKFEPDARAHDRDALAKVMILRKYITILPWRASYLDGEEEVLIDRIAKLLHFDFEFDTHLTLDTTVGTVEDEVTADVPFATDFDHIGKIKGTAPLQWPTRQHYQAPPCSILLVDPQPGVLSVMGLGIRGSKTDKTWTITDIIVDAYPDRVYDGYVLRCPDVGDIDLYYFWPEFGVVHEAELSYFPQKPIAQPMATYRFDGGWAIRPNRDAIIGTRKYNATREFQKGTLHEQTKLILRHTPQ